MKVIWLKNMNSLRQSAVQIKVRHKIVVYRKQKPLLVVCSTKKDDIAAAFRQALSGEVDPMYQEGAAFLQSLGIVNPGEIARILDIAMNPNSLFLDKQTRKRSNPIAKARRLTVQEDMIPVLSYLQEIGLQPSQIAKVIRKHPPVLSYSVSDRIKPFFEYLNELGVENPATTVMERPSILGLNVDENLRRIVEYLQENDYSTEDIIYYVENTL
eukprot:TRINITY_DN2895_c0_g1_i1.p2 TRINITY_DN2895_c0_g1~~TRINITY_DN2895_c0_g1_i1.p2  ORF type:complete len:213 (+),score=25.39 TRINITY_DN2895_c0_g1_i1:173-811(+)